MSVADVIALLLWALGAAMALAEHGGEVDEACDGWGEAAVIAVTAAIWPLWTTFGVLRQAWMAARAEKS